MHLITTIPGGWNPNDEGVFYVEQKPGDILFLSAADTELYTMNKVYSARHNHIETIPSFRLANLTYFKQELTVDTYLDEVVANAKIVVLKLLGGISYFSYLCEAIIECAAENDVQVIFLPGDAKPDLELMKMSSVDLKIVDHLWKLLLAGGIKNTEAAMDSMFKLLDSSSIEISAPEFLPEYFFMNSKKEVLKEIPSKEDSSTSLICSYRSYFQSDNLDPIIQLMTTLKDQGIHAYAFFAQSYRDPQLENQLLKGIGENMPNVIINTTGFSIQSFNDASDGIFDRLNIPVLQAIVASCNKETWKEGMFGLTPTDIAMQVTLPEVDSKIITSVISFKESTGKSELTDSEVVQYIPHKEGIKAIADHVESWCKVQSLPNDQKKLHLFYQIIQARIVDWQMELD